MTKKFLIIFLSLFPIIEIFYSCNPCKGIVTKYGMYSHKTLVLKNLDTSREFFEETEKLQFNKNDYGIRVLITRELNTSYSKSVSRRQQSNFSFIQSANAFSYNCPPEYSFSAADSLTSVKIFSINNFDENHLENSDISNYFLVKPLYYDVYFDFEEFIKWLEYTVESNDEHYYDKFLIFDLLLKTAPTTDNKHQFKIVVELSDGRILEQQTSEVELL